MNRRGKDRTGAGVRTAVFAAAVGLLGTGPSRTDRKAPAQGPGTGSRVIAKSVLRDKVKGGWAGQTIGCTFGGPTEFRFRGTFIPDYQPIPWSEDAVLSAFRNAPGLYDDVYMDLTFVDVLEKEGLEASAESFGRAPTLFWKYGLPEGRHVVRLKLVRDAEAGKASVRLFDAVLYASRPPKTAQERGPR